MDIKHDIIPVVFALFFCALIVGVLTHHMTKADMASLTASPYGFSKAEYCGHTYIVWKSPYKGGIMHDPDCSCHNRDVVVAGYTITAEQWLEMWDETQRELDDGQWRRLVAERDMPL